MIKPLILSFQENKKENTSYKFIPVFCFILFKNNFGVVCVTSFTFRADISSSCCVDVMMMALFQITYGCRWYVTFSVGEREHTSPADAAVSTMCYRRSE